MHRRTLSLRWMLGLGVAALSACGDGGDANSNWSGYDAGLVTADTGVAPSTPGGTTAGTAGGTTAGTITPGGTTAGTAGGTTAGTTPIVVMDAGGGMPGGSGDAGVPDAMVVGNGPFPRADEAVNVEMMGPYQFETYEMNLNDPAYRNPKIWYPKDAKPPFAAVVLSLGFTETRSALEWWGPVLASHGFISFHNDPTTAGDSPTMRAADIKAQIEKLKAEHARAGGPLQGKIDLKRLGVMGHSMGGGGTLTAGNALGDAVQALVPLQPWSEDRGLLDPEGIVAFPNATAPTLIIGAQNDFVAEPALHSLPFYETLKAEKVYAEVKGADHMVGTGSGPAMQRALQARLTLAWYKLKLEGDMRYETYIYGEKQKEVAAQLSVFKGSKVSN